MRATWGSSGQASAVFALSESGATLVDHGSLGAGAEADPDRLCRMELRVETPNGAWAVRLATAIYDEPRAIHWDDAGLFVVGYGFTVYAFGARTGALAWSHQTGTPVVELIASPRFGHVIVQSEIETWAIRGDGEVRWRLAHSDIVGAAELIGGRLILTSVHGEAQSIDPNTGAHG
ncbi:MAG: hypothetical protein EBU83_04740 [bacterium]|nr:hypothetical protein [Candidatus Aquidulcis sp.]